MKDSKKIGLRIASLTLCLAIACGGSIAVVRASGENTESGSTSASSESSAASAAATAASGDGSAYKEETVYVLDTDAT